MTEQRDLWDGDWTLTPSHSDDPVESRLAASNVNAVDQFHRIMSALYNATEPLTDDQLAEQTGLIRTSAGTRRGVAVKRGLVERYGTGMSAMGNPAAQWRITEAGRRWVRDNGRAVA